MDKLFEEITMSTKGRTRVSLGHLTAGEQNGPPAPELRKGGWINTVGTD